MKKMTKEIEIAETILIFSGEGEIGTFEKFTGKRTIRAIKSKLTKERCHGDRWARLYVSGGNDYKANTFLEIDDESGDITDMRTVTSDRIR